MLEFLIMILFLIAGLVLGFYLLLLGRRMLLLTAAIICLASVASLLAMIFLDDPSGWALTEEPSWLYLGIAFGAGIIGGVLGAIRKRIAAMVIGFFAGGYMTLWLYDIAIYLVVRIGNWPKETAFWVGVIIFIAGGLAGLYLTRRSQAVALILISVFIGVDIITESLGFSPSSSFTAVVTLSLALLGLVFQYTQYLRENITDQGRPYMASDIGVAPATELFDLDDD